MTEVADFKLTIGDKNVGTVYRPQGPGPFPVFIYCHGSHGGRQLDASLTALMEGLTAKGMALVAFDFYGCGDTGGDYNGMTYARWTANLAEVFAWISAQDWALKTAIGCMGYSSGSSAALRFAAGNPSLRFVISLATVLGAHHSMLGGGPGRQLAVHWDELQAGGKAQLADDHFPLAYYKDLMGYQPIQEMKRIHCPVFFLEGSADNPYRRADGWLGHLLHQRDGFPSKYLEIQDGDHGCFNLGEERNQVIFDYLKELGVA
jgi:predicted acyl esterase